MSGYTAVDDDAMELYASFAEAHFARTGEEWPEPMARTHLRRLLGERRTGARKASEWPTVRELAQKWNWRTPKGEPARDRVATYLSKARKVEVDGKPVEILHWQDPGRTASLEWLRGDRLLGANRPGARQASDGDPTATRREADGDPTARTDERRESEAEPDGDPTATRREADGDPTPCARSPRALPPDHRPPSTGGDLFSPPADAAAPTEATPETGKPKPSRKPASPKADPKPTGPHRLATLAWDAEFAAAFDGAEYPWLFRGRDHDGSKVKTWLEVARVDAADPDPGINRLRVAMRAYFAAVNARTAFPANKPATTHWFTRDVVTWLQTDPGATGPPPRAVPTNGHDSRRRGSLLDAYAASLEPEPATPGPTRIVIEVPP